MWTPDIEAIVERIYHKRVTIYMNPETRKYLAEIGRRGGKRSRRTLDPATAREMVRVREARRAFKRFHALCFWYNPPDLSIGVEDIDWVVDALRKNGNREAWEVAARLCL